MLNIELQNYAKIDVKFFVNGLAYYIQTSFCDTTSGYATLLAFTSYSEIEI